MPRARWILIVAAGLALPILAADPPSKGVEPGQVLPGPFNAFVVTGGPKPPPTDPIQTEERQNYGDPSRANKFHCLVTRYGLDPTVAIFTREAPPADDQPLAKLIKSLDDSVQKNRTARLHSFAIFLRLKDEFLKDDARIPQVNQIRDFSAKLELKELALAIDQAESDRTKAYKIGQDDTVTVLLYENLQVKTRFVFTTEKPLDDEGVKTIEDAVKKLIKK